MKKLFLLTGLFTSALSFAMPVQSFPFYESSASFQAYLNTLTWKDGSTVRFSNLNSCFSADEMLQGLQAIAALPGQNFKRNKGDLNYYKCTDGFVTVVNPMGRKVCNLAEVVYVSGPGGRSSTYKTGQCRYS